VVAVDLLLQLLLLGLAASKNSAAAVVATLLLLQQGSLQLGEWGFRVDLLLEKDCPADRDLCDEKTNWEWLSGRRLEVDWGFLHCDGVLGIVFGGWS